jgi:hypothetical protein
MGWISKQMGGWLAGYLTKQVNVYVEFSVQSPDILRQHLQPGDVLLVEGNERISVAIKYLTQSTWSHAALYVGRALGVDQPDLIEADLEQGVVAVRVEKYRNQNTRICRPVSLSPEDKAQLIDFAVAHIGDTYDLKNVFDLARYLLPTPPVPQRWRHRLLTMGSGDPTRAICSTLIAEAFQSVGYPVLPQTAKQADENKDDGRTAWAVRHHSLFTPRDFDLSPYFATVKPTIEDGFDYKNFNWSVDRDSQS